METDTRQKEETRNNSRNFECVSVTVSDLCPLPVTSLQEPGCCMLQHMDFRSAGERDRMSTNLKLLAAIVLRVLAEPSVGKEGIIHSVKILFEW